MKKSEIFLHTLISNKLYSVIIYALYNNFMIKWTNLAAAQFK